MTRLADRACARLTLARRAPKIGVMPVVNHLELRIDDAVLALLYLDLHDGVRAWKGFDWDAMNRLHEKGYISDPRSKTKAVVFNEDGLGRAERLLGPPLARASRFKFGSTPLEGVSEMAPRRGGWEANPCREKSGATTNLEKRVDRVRLPA